MLQRVRRCIEPASDMKLSSVLFVALLLMNPTHSSAQGGDRLTGEPFATRSPVIARNGMAATSHPLASAAAIDILKSGGSAIDAAIAANAVLGLMEPTGCGIGGDLFAIVWDPEARELTGLNASGRSPRSLTLADIKAKIGDRRSIPIHGTLSVSVPGAVDGWFELHDRYGRLPMSDVLAPAIAYAREGFPVTQVIAYYWESNFNRFADSEWIEEFDNARATFLLDGEPPQEGEIFRNPDLARTYETIASGGRASFYTGEIAKTIDSYMRRIGGALSYEDLSSHASTWVEPLSVNYRGYDVYELPPNGQGVAALQMLNILEGFDIEAMGHNTTEYLHVQTEAKKLAFEDRARFYADMEFYDPPLDRLLSKEYADHQRSLIRMNRVMRDKQDAASALEGGDTIYLTVADRSGMMVSLIQSNYTGMGSGLVPDGLGFMLQDRGALFNLDPTHPNGYRPGKRPFHTIIPAFVMKDGQPFMSFGVMGGAMQPQGHVQILCNIIDFGMNVQEAGDAARYRHRGSSQPTGETMRNGGVLTLESGIDPNVVAALERLGHRVRVQPGGFGGYQAILWDAKNGVYRGASEMRKDGQVIGY